MILKRFTAPTLEAAKAEAREIYGEEFVLLESDPGRSGDGARITVIVDPRSGSDIGETDEENDLVVIRPTPVRGVLPGRRRSPLESVRSFARVQERESELRKRDESMAPPPELNSIHSNGLTGTPEATPTSDAPADPSVVTTSYRRSMARPNAPGIRDAFRANGTAERDDDALSETNGRDSESGTREFASRPPTKDTPRTVPDGTSLKKERQHLRELEALHRRFDKIESALESSILSANLEYLAHPSFQQLVKVGVHPTVIAGWFSSILKEGVDPYKEGRLFMERLAGILRSTVSRTSDAPTRPFLLFTGPSGGGKTSLIQKWVLHPECTSGKSVAVVSLMKSKSEPYYSVLDPFCRDREIPYYELYPGESLDPFLEEWRSYNHVLIDTPSLQIHQPESFRRFREQRQWLAECAPMEVHYVVNAASQSLYFRGEAEASHPVKPDYLDITHLDEVVKWGHLLPMLQNLEIPTRYVSRGTGIPDALLPYDPAWFTRQLLKKESAL